METPRTNRLAKAQAEISNEEVWHGELAFIHSVLAQVSLPYRNLGDTRTYERTSGGFSVLVEAGQVWDIGQFPPKWHPLALPFGTRARLILLHLGSLAVKQQSPVVEVEPSFTSFCREIGITHTTGNNLASVREQLNRLAVLSVRLSADLGGNKTAVFQGHIFENLSVVFTNHPKQLPIWASQVKFSPRFYQSLREHAIPLDFRAIKALQHSARAIDIYCWLASRLWRLDRPIDIKNSSLQRQFGFGTLTHSHSSAFMTALGQVLNVYPTAKVEPIDGGVRLFPSPPPIKPKQSLLP